MKITDIKKTDLPLRVKLTDKFTLDESLDPGTIVQINNYKVDFMEDEGDASYEVFVTVLASNYEHWQETIYVMGNDDAFEIVDNKTYTLVLEDVTDKNGEISELHMYISEETRNVLSQMSSVVIEGDGTTYIISNRVFHIIKNE